MTDHFSSLPLDVWLSIAQFLPVEVINTLCSVSTHITSVCTSEEISKDLLARDYSAISPKLLLSWKLLHNTKAFLRTPYRETYCVVHRRITAWCDKFFDDFSTCNVRYVRKDLMLQDMREDINALISYNKQDKKEEVGVLSHTLLRIVSCLDEYLIPSGEACDYRYWEEQEEAYASSCKSYYQTSNRAFNYTACASCMKNTTTF